MGMIDKKVVELNNGERDLDILVYLKKIHVKGDGKKIKAFCRVV